MKIRRVNTVTLVVTERCNQACDYCYVPRTARDMSRDTAERALDLLFRWAKDAPEVTVAFFGGEPLLAPDLIEYVCDAALERAQPRQRVVFSLTTNGTALNAKARRLLERYPFQLAVSFDGVSGQAHRPLLGGRPSLEQLLANLPFLFKVGGRDLLARMTVTPQNVATFFEDVVSVHEAGFRRIAYLPAYEMAWDDVAMGLWKRQLERLTVWMAGRIGAKRSIPNFPFWSGRRYVLSGGTPDHCGAGVTQVAVSVNGELYPCYRFVHAPERSAFLLGNVEEGITRPDLQAVLAGLDPGRHRPQSGSCRGCPLKGVCGFFCPAVSHILAGDPGVVPEVACRLERIETDVVAAWFGQKRVSGQVRQWVKRVGMAAAVAAAVLSPALSGCDRNVGGGGSRDAGILEAAVPDGHPDRGIQPGICAVRPPDGSVDVGIQPGLCPAPLPDGSVDVGIQPGLCPAPLPDGSVDVGIQPGLCPAPLPDASRDTGGLPGIC